MQVTDVMKAAREFQKLRGLLEQRLSSSYSLAHIMIFAFPFEPCAELRRIDMVETCKTLESYDCCVKFEGLFFFSFIALAPLCVMTPFFLRAGRPIAGYLIPRIPFFSRLGLLDYLLQ